MGLDVVLADLEADGYTCGAVVIPAGAVNALHRRDRVWIMAHAERGESQSGPFADQVRRWARKAEQVGMGGGRTALANAASIGERESADETDALAIGWDAWQVTRSGGRNATVANAHAGQRHGAISQVRAGRHAADAGGADLPDAQRRGQLGSWLRGNARHQAAHRERAAGDVVDAGPAAEGTEVARALDVGPDGIPAGLVRRPATGPDAIRDRWADGSWEDGLPRVVTSEPDRKHKLMAAGNAIVPQVAYELLRVMTGPLA